MFCLISFKLFEIMQYVLLVSLSIKSVYLGLDQSLKAKSVCQK